ncbi:MAG: hypothetical protein U1F81_04445 [Verrucomicrobiaceae bacterium]
MAITIEKNQGIRLALASAVPTPLHQSREAGGYYKVRSYHGGGEFFQQENAQLILQCLGDFLPRAVERAGPDGRMEIFYQHLVSGQDVSSRTAPLNSGVDVPAAELKRLESAIAQLKAKENDPGTDPTKREIIRAFRLPSPQKDPELYRLHGSGTARRLLVLWGVEKEAGSSLTPQEALHQVPQTKRGIPWWLSLLLALLFLALLAWWWSHQQAGRPLGLSNSSSSTPVAILSPDGGNKSAGGTPNSLIILPGESKSTQTSTKSPDGAASSSNPQPLADENGPPGTTSTAKREAGSQPPPYDSNGTKGTVAGAPSNSSADPKGTSSPAGSDPASTTPDGKSTMQPPGPSADAKGTPSTPSPDGKPSSSSTNPPVPKGGEPPATATTRRSTTLPDEPKKDNSNKPGDPKPTPPGQMAATEPPKSPTTPPGTPSTAPGKPVGAHEALSAEIVNARTSAVPKDGKVEMQLSALARDENGKAINISKVESWTVDGKPQLDAAGRPITTNGLPVNLTEGVHRVRITGTAENGRPIAAEADVNVDIAVREESTVRVKQIGKP